MGAILAALIAVSGALIVGYITNFVAEDFRRFRDGTAVAASLAGELSSHFKAVPALREGLQGRIKRIEDKAERFPFPEIDTPTDPLFDSIVDKLGLLESEMVEDMVYTYQQIRAFRVSVKIVGQGHAVMTDVVLLGQLRLALHSIDLAVERGVPLLDALRNRTRKTYEAPKPWLWYR
ncbi:hypothetical protein V8G57_15465 [Collimonas sp. H4R21]|uniref:Uncharacterized protein n=1 Tax=Collimonas rhizosphaerae TaxID=3126357 RepID=A0ABU9PXR1_9BURK